MLSTVTVWSWECGYECYWLILMMLSKDYNGICIELYRYSGHKELSSLLVKYLFFIINSARSARNTMTIHSCLILILHIKNIVDVFLLMLCGIPANCFAFSLPISLVYWYPLRYHLPQSRSFSLRHSQRLTRVGPSLSSMAPCSYIEA